MNLVQQEVGVAEQPPGSNDSPRIAQYRQATAGSGVGPWCAYFTSWAAREAGVPLGDNGQGFGRVDDVYAWAQKAGKAIPNRAAASAAARRPDRLGRAHRRRRVRRRRRHDQHDRGQLLRSGLRALLRARARAPPSATSASGNVPGPMADPETEELQIEQVQREHAEREQAGDADLPTEEHTARAPRGQARVSAREARRACAVGGGRRVGPASR